MGIRYLEGLRLNRQPMLMTTGMNNTTTGVLLMKATDQQDDQHGEVRPAPGQIHHLVPDIGHGAGAQHGLADQKHGPNRDHGRVGQASNALSRGQNAGQSQYDHDPDGRQIDSDFFRHQQIDAEDQKACDDPDAHSGVPASQ